MGIKLSNTSLKTLDELKQDKINKFDEKCNLSILDGFYSSVLGESHLYGFDYEDQTNFSYKMLELILNPNMEAIYWRPKDSLLPILHTREQFLALQLDIKNHKEGTIAKFWTLKAHVLSAINVNEVNSIVW